MLNASGPQTVTVQVEDDPLDLAKPRGKQDWQPESHGIWYPRTTGIWQTVWLEQVGRTYVSALRWTPSVENFAIRLQAEIGGDPEADLALEVRLTCGERVLAHDRYRVVDRDIDRQIALSDPGIDDFRNELLWSPERPTLFDVEIRLWAGAELIDAISSYTALRTVNILRDRFMLNGGRICCAWCSTRVLADTLLAARTTKRCAATCCWPRRWGQRRAQAPEGRQPRTSTGPTAWA